ncbi:MAG: LPS-assembly protein LptD [Deltaproteobacteria bacterium]|nr:LPS-assembly protein LptD [Deltaproteobacteria bacterium]
MKKPYYHFIVCGYPTMVPEKPQNKINTYTDRPLGANVLFFHFFWKNTICLAVLLFILSATVVFPSDEAYDHFFKGDDPDAPWHINADEIDYDQKEEQYIARGHVTITKNSKTIEADFIRFNHKTMDIFATGHVLIATGTDLLTATSLEMNLKDEIGTLYNGTLFYRANHFYLKGNTIKKIGKDTFTIDKGSITTCDGDHPAWKITGRNLKVTIEGYGTVNHAALRVKNIPVLYAPYLAFPVKLKRQSGFLTPQIGYSDRKGAQYVQPFFWAINDQSDATFYGHLMQSRGIQWGLEYRYVLDDMSKGTLMFDILDDRKIDDGTGDSSKKWGYENDDLLRPNSDRYWFRMKNNQALPLGFTAKIDLDVVSDQDYLQEFKYGYTGFDATKSYYDEFFGRAIDGYDDPIRVNSLNINKIWPQYSLNAEARWYDDARQGPRNDTETSLQNLPFITFNGSKQPILKTPLYFDLKSSYAYFFRETGDKAQRADVYPRLYLPYSVQSYFFFEPSIGVRGTVWHLDQDEAASSNKDWESYRGMYDLKLDLSTEFFQVYPFKGVKIDRFKHKVRPRIVYDYTPNQFQDNFPFFDSIDRIDRQNVLTYSLTNTFISRSRRYQTQPNGPPKTIPEDAKKQELPDYSYAQPCRIELEQQYDFNKANENDPEPLSPIYGKLQLEPARYLSLQADANWSVYDTAFMSHNLAVILRDNRGDRAFIEHRYKRDTSESIYTDLTVEISRRLSTNITYERNIQDGKNIKTGLGFLYRAQCWSLILQYINEAEDRKYAFMINLHGLGGYGQSIGF